MKWSFTNNKTWSELEQKFSWVSDMNGVVQDNIHHAEGDVATHTKMVLAALQSLQEFQQLDEQTQEVLWTSALLHDVEKRSTTVIEDDGRITFKGSCKER